MNPDWDCRLWDNRCELLNDPACQKAIREGQPWAFVADRLRLLILREMGGAYCDVDAMPIRPLTPLWQSVKGASFVGSRAQDVPCDVGFMMASPGCPIVDGLLRRFPEVRYFGRKVRIWLEENPDGIDWLAPEIALAKEITEQTVVWQWPLRMGSWRGPVRPAKVIALGLRADGQWEIIGQGGNMLQVAPILEQSEGEGYVLRGLIRDPESKLDKRRK